MPVRPLALVAVLFAAAACSSPRQVTGAPDTGTNSTPDAGNPMVVPDAGQPAPDAGPDIGPVSTMYPASFPAPPQIVTGGGPTLTSPRFVPVFFKNDDAATVAKLTDFVSKVGATKFWTAATSEYGVGPGTATAAVMLTEIAPAQTDDATIQTWLAGKLNGNDPAFPAPDANTIYSLHYPAGTTITLMGGMGAQQSCNTFGGYHSDITLDAAHGTLPVAYAVLPRCQMQGGSVLDTTTGSESHELVEAATDPYPMQNPAYSQTDQAHFYWIFTLGGGEDSDMCAQSPDSFTRFAELPYVVQRSWSNKAVMAGRDPCVPELPGEVYFNSPAELNDSITLGGGGQSITLQGAKIPVGTSQVINLDLYSEGDTGGPWTVEAKDGNELQGGRAQLSFSFDQNSGQNGQTLHMTVKTLSASQYGAHVFYIISSRGQQRHYWLGLVGD
jgi:hypothetical protein